MEKGVVKLYQCDPDLNLFGMIVLDLRWECFVWELSFGNFRLEVIAWKLPFDIVRLVPCVIVRLTICVWELAFGDLRLGKPVREFSFGI